MEKIKVMIVAPYEGMAELVRAIEPRYKDILQIKTVVGDLEEGLKQSSAAQTQGYDIIISRGGTAQMLRKIVTLPVLDVEVSGYDYIRTIKMADNYSGKAALVGFPKITAGAQSISEIINVQIRIVTVNEGSEVSSALEQLRLEGYTLIIGDMITVKVARKLGINSLLLTSGEESVSNALSNAIYMNKWLRHYRNECGMLTQTVRQVDERVWVWSPSGGLRFRSCELADLELREEDLLHYADNILTNGKQEAVLQTKNGYVAMRGQKFCVDGEDMISFCLRPLKNERLRSIRGVSFKNALPVVEKGIFSESSRYDDRTVKLARACCDTDQSVLILGEVGVGKAVLAESIYRGGKRRFAPMLQIDCDLLAAEDWMELSNKWSEFSSLLENGTICVCEVNKTPLTMQQYLLTMLEEAAEWNCRIISTATQALEEMTTTGAFLTRLYIRLANVTLYLPSMRDRKEDLQDIASLFIMDANFKYGKQVVGITPDAFEKMKEFPWPGNYDQLKSVIDQMVMMSDGVYLDIDDLNMALQRPHITAHPSFSLEGTLDDITNRVIQMVLNEENGNITRAAKRLGVGRSTLWRRMKQ